MPRLQDTFPDTLAKTCKSGSNRPVALGSRIEGGSGWLDTHLVTQIPKMVSKCTAKWVPSNEFESLATPTWPMTDSLRDC